jgi:NAD(P) transhydrogenase subunit alpha
MPPGAGGVINLEDAAFPDVLFSKDVEALVAQADVVLAVQAPDAATIAAIREGAILICFLDEQAEPKLLKPLLARKITCFAMQNIPRISRAQAMDALSSQAALSGYLSVMLGAGLLRRVLPKITSAAGAIGPAKVIILKSFLRSFFLKKRPLA